MNILISACLLGCACRYDGGSRPLPEEKLSALKRKHTLIPVCPEIYGGLPTPRPSAERRGEGVFTQAGDDVTERYIKGARECVRIARLCGCTHAVLKSKSPACGVSEIYNGKFTRTLVPGLGVAAQLLSEAGVKLLSEDELDILM